MTIIRTAECYCAAMLTGIMVLSAAAGPISVPSSDDFESYPVGTPLVDGTNGWYASSNIVIVQDSVAYAGIKSAMIPPDCYLSNRFDEVSNSNIWVRMRIMPSLDNAAGMADYERGTNSTAIFYVNTSGYCVVYNGTNGWSEISTQNNGSPATRIASNAWSRVDLRLDYSTRIWALFVNYEILRTNLAFASSTSKFSGFDIHGPGLEKTNYVDDVTLTYLEQTDFATLAIDTTNITRTIVFGQNVASNSFNVWNSSNSSALYFTNTIVFSGPETNWLSVTPVSDVSHGETKAVWLSFNTTNLPMSVTPYQATVRIDASDGLFGMQAVGSPKTVTVSVYVNNGPVLRINQTNFSRTISVGQRAEGQEFTVANASTAPRIAMAYTVTSGTNWITVNPASGAVIDDTNTIALAYPTENLEPGWHTGRVTVVATGIDTQQVSVVMRVNSVPGLSWDAGLRTWTNIITEGETLAGYNFDVWNGSAPPMGTLRFVISSDSSWITLSPLGGTSAGDHNAITVTYNVSNLPAGVYTGTITLTGVDDVTEGAASNSPLTIVASLTVRGRAVLEVDTAILTNSVLENYGTTNSSSFSVWNGAAGAGVPLNGLTYTITSYASWLTVSPSGGTITSGTHVIATVWLGGDLAPDNYTGYILIDAIDQTTGARAAGAPKTINLSFSVISRLPVNYEKPTVYGVPFVRQTLTGRKGLWQNMDRLTFTYQWQHADNTAGAGLVDLSGETTTNHVVMENEKGKYMRIAVTATDANPRPRVTTAYSDFGVSAKIKAMPGDFNGDGITDLWFFDPATAMWRASFNSDIFAEGLFGDPGMTDVPGDYNSDGILDLGLYDRSNGMWHILYLPNGPSLSGSMFGGLREECEAAPVPQDYDGDGQTDIALYWNGYWAILKSTLGRIVIVSPIAGTEGAPAPGDYDGDGIFDLAVYNSGLWTIRNVLGQEWTVRFGSADWMPAAGDYDGDTLADLCIFNQASNIWKMIYSSTGLTNDTTFGSSIGNNFPRQGYYDRDRYCDPATLHYSEDGDFLIWCVTRSRYTNFPYRGQSYQRSIDNWRVSW